MPESYIQLPPQSTGLKAHTYSRTIGAHLVEDEVVLLGEPYLPSYAAFTSGGVSAASGANPPIVLNAGASLLLRIRRIRIELRAAAGAGLVELAIRRCTSAPSGGAAITPAPYDAADPASGASAMSAPTGGATPGTQLMRASLHSTASAPQSARPAWEWTQLPNSKPIVIPAGTANGLRVEVATGQASASVNVLVEFDEAPF